MRKWLGMEKEPEKETEWREGNAALTCEALLNWAWGLELKDIDMHRANGKAERMGWTLELDRGSLEVYFMVGHKDDPPDSEGKELKRRDEIRLRGSGCVKVDDKNNVFSPIPKDEWTSGFVADGGILRFKVNGAVIRSFSIGSAVIKRIVISPDPKRPAGIKWRNARYTKV